MKMMMTMKEMFSEERKETRALVLDILQGRQMQTSQPVIGQMQRELLTSYDAELTPLPAELDAVMAREAAETEQATLLRERAALQSRLTELQQEMTSLSDSEESYVPFSEPEDEAEMVDQP